VRLLTDRHHLTGDVEVRFRHVAGGLQAPGRPWGFSIPDTDGTETIYDVRLHGARALLKTSMSPALLASLPLYYGRGTNPYCNITDGRDRSLPVLGGLALGRPRALLRHVQTLRVSAFQPGAGRLHRLGCPRRLAPLGLAVTPFPSPFCSMREAIVARGHRDEVLFYVCEFTCAEPMQLALRLGYDGPLKIWIDGRTIYHDPAGTNPAIIDAKAVPFRAGRGRHRAVIALGTNSGAAWGIFLRFERLDVPRRLILAGSEHYRMPAVLG
jgi:hypothetical protein